MSNETYTVESPESGRKWTLKPIPKHFYLMYGQMPSTLTERAAEALNAQNAVELEKELDRTLSAEQKMQLMIFIREAVNFACVNPKLSLNPSGPDQISPLELSEAEFNWLSGIVLNPRGAEAERLRNFRSESDKSPKRSASGKKLRTKTK